MAYAHGDKLACMGGAVWRLMFERSETLTALEVLYDRRGRVGNPSDIQVPQYMPLVAQLYYWQK
jgi:hypothetical protein